MIADTTSINEFPDIQSGRYRIVALLGSGGAGRVYKAIDTTLDKTVAIKQLHSMKDIDAVRFQREAKLAGVLKHPNVMQVYDFGFTQKQEPYLVVEYVEGKTLAERLDDNNGPIPRTVALKILLQIASGMFHAHSNNVIHRDIKPGNVILVEAEELLEVRALIVDFGLAKQQNEAQSLTTPGIGMGTPQYMPPEQIRGQKVDHRSDIYSFGCLMFETLTGVAPFEADSLMQMLEHHLSKSAPSLEESFKNSKHASLLSDTEEPEFSESLEAIVRRCLQKSAEDRYQSAELLCHDLQDELQRELLRYNTINEMEPPPQEADLNIKTGLTSSRRPGAAAILIACSVIAVGTLLLIRPNLSNDHPVKDVPVEGAVGEGILGAKTSSVPLAGVLRSKTGVLEVLADDDAQLKEFLRGQKAKRIDLSASTFTPKGFREAETQYVTQITYIHDGMNRSYLEAFVEPKHIMKLRIGGMKNFNSDDLSVLNSGSELSHLAIVYQPLSLHDFENIVKLDRLEELDLSDCKDITADKLLLLKKLPHLNSLTLDNTGVTDKEIKVISTLDLNYLGLKICNDLTQKGFEDLGRMKNLKKLNLRGTNYSMDCLRAFRKHNSKVVPDRSGLRKPKPLDYAEMPYGM